jgi:hypothetical protein
MPVPDEAHNVPGMLLGYVATEGNGAPSVEIRKDDSSEWRKITSFKKEGLHSVGELFDWGTSNGALQWQMRQSGNAAFQLNYMRFYPAAVEWQSPPYLLSPSSRGKTLTFSVSAGDMTEWKSFIIDWRTGKAASNGDIEWSNWETSEGAQHLQMSCDQYVQLRILGVPRDGEKPYLENFRLSAQ